MNLLLTSNGFYTEAIKEQFLKCIENPTDMLQVAIVTTASPQKEKNRFAQKAKLDFIEMGVKNVEFIDIEFDEPATLLSKDVIYINGGNPYNLLFHIKRSGADNIIQQMKSSNVVIIGVSAGTILLGPSIKIVDFFTPQMNTVDLKNLAALRLTDKLVFPHYDREDLFIDNTDRTIEDRIKEFETVEGFEVTRLKDYEYISVEV